MSAVDTDQQMDQVIDLLERIAEAVEDMAARKDEPLLDGVRQRLETLVRENAAKRAAAK